jgi:hypothetical protein
MLTVKSSMMSTNMDKQLVGGKNGLEIRLKEMITKIMMLLMEMKRLLLA